MNFSLLGAELLEDEGFKELPYDDSTGLALKAGDTIRGNVTFGIGFTNVTQEEASAMLAIRMRTVAAGLTARLPWLSALSDARQRALTNMAFNLGIDGLLEFITFLRLMQNGEFGQAADDLLQTKWARQVGARCDRIVALIRTG